MAQLGANEGKALVVRTELVRLSEADIARRIQSLSRTVIGRAMNPKEQSVDSLVFVLPKLWKMENKVVGKELGCIFRFDFQSEEDIEEVIRNGPYQFDSWMLSLVKWEPIISSEYPSAITFWVKVLGIPPHYWFEETLRSVGNELGQVIEVDEESGRVRVTVNGFKPLIFKTLIEFENGEEAEIGLEYDKLGNFCHQCHKLTHDKKYCPDLEGKILD